MKQQSEPNKLILPTQPKDSARTLLVASERRCDKENYDQDLPVKLARHRGSNLAEAMLD